MPKALLDYLGYCIYFWTNEGQPLEPVHVHVVKGKPTPEATKIWITKDGAMIEENKGIPKQDLKKIIKFINENKLEIIGRWLDNFGEARQK